MASEIEMDELKGSSPMSPSEGAQEEDNVGSANNLKDSTISLWAWTSTTLILLFAVALVLFPRVLLFAAAEKSNERRTSITPLESFLALHFGIFLVAIALGLVLNVPYGALPPVPSSQPQPPPSHPLLSPLTAATLLTAFISYNTTSVGSLASVVFVGSVVIGLWGLWAIVFAGSYFVSKKTGADKHTSAFLFRNKNAASVQKKRWRKEHKGRT